MPLKLSCPVVVVVLASSSALHADDVVIRDILTCSAIVQDPVRLACYDEIVHGIPRDGQAQTTESQSVQAAGPPPAPPAAESAAPDPEPLPTKQSGYPPLTDDVGLPAGRGVDDDGTAAMGARVVRCRPGATGKHFFYFENGQVWQESNVGRRDFEDCDFFVTITRDTFGYRMTPEGASYRVRISRIR